MCTCRFKYFEYQHKLSFYHSLCDSFSTFVLLSPGGALILYNFMIMITKMTVAKTYIRGFISDLLFLKKVTNKPES